MKYKGNYYILEIKTETSFKFNARYSVAEEHKSQAAAYSLVLGLDEVMFLYVCRDNLQILPILYKVDEDSKSKLYQLILDCTNYVLNKALPPKPSNLPTSVCNYCMYKSKCKENVSETHI